MLGQPMVPMVLSMAPTIGPNLPGQLNNSAFTRDRKTGSSGAVLRRSAGKTWADTSLAEWPAEDCRLFCGDLGNEVTDDLLANAFRSFKSFQKARVVRDKRTSKTKGFGFVSFSQPEDMITALREVQGKYIGNRPVRLKKSTWKDKNIDNEKHKLLLDFDFTTPAVTKALKKFKKVKVKTTKKKETK